MFSMFSCKFCERNCKSKSSVLQHQVRCSKNPSKMNLDYLHTEEHKQKLSKYLEKGTQNLIKKNNQRFGLMILKSKKCKNCGNVFTYFEKEFINKHSNYCNSSCAHSRIHTEETKKKIGVTLRGTLTMLEINGTIRSKYTSNRQLNFLPFEKGYSGRTGEKCKVRFCIICSMLILDEKYKLTCGKENCKVKHKEKTNFESHIRGLEKNLLEGGFPQNYTRSYSYKYLTKEGKEVLLQSSYELKVAQELDENNILWSRPKFLWWTDSKNRKHRYYPDFYLTDYDTYLDPKNSYLVLKDAEKIERVKKENNVKVFILKEDELTWDKIKEVITCSNSLIG